MNPSRNKPLIPSIMLDVLRDLHFERGVSIEELASALDLPERALRSAFIKRGFYQKGWTDAEIRRLHVRYLAGEFASSLAKLRRCSSSELLSRFRKLGLPVLPKKKYIVSKRRLPDSLILAMYADYKSGMTFSQVARKHDRPPQSVRPLFTHRGFELREPKGITKFRLPDGSFAPYIPKTDEEIEEILKRARKVMVPEDLRLDWRKWDLTRRGAFIARLRTLLPSDEDRPVSPFSGNVEPFDYASERAWEIVRAKNGRSSSQQWKARILPSSQGLIYNNVLYFWSGHGNGYYEGCSWTPDRGRPGLNHIIWCEQNGRAIPDSHVVRHADGNPNNFEPSNLVLAHRNEVARENQAAALNRKSRERTRLLLERSNQPKNGNDLVKSLTQD